MIGSNAGWRVGDAALALLAGLLAGTLAQAVLGFDDPTVTGIFAFVIPAFH